MQRRFIRYALIWFVIIVVLAIFAFRPPSAWKQVSVGMSRTQVYSLAGRPDINNESTKGGVCYKRNALVEMREMDVFFRADDTVESAAQRWRWKW